MSANYFPSLIFTTTNNYTEQLAQPLGAFSGEAESPAYFRRRFQIREISQLRCMGERK